MKKPQLIVCAAIRHRTDGTIICGPRHGNCLNMAMRYGLDPSPGSENWECGFVDQENNFLTRAEAWVIADRMGQIRCPTGLERHYNNHRVANVGDEGLLFSENLY